MAYALITGASTGIGKSIAYLLAAKNTKLLLVARSETLLKEMSAALPAQYGIDVQYLTIDLAHEDAAESIFSWVNRNNWPVTMLINNAGYGLSGGFEKYTAQDHAAMMQVNMTTLVNLVALFLPLLKKQPGQSYILNIASTAAYQAIPYLSTYAASKSFVVSFSRALKQELKKTNVSVTCVSPGGTDTDFSQRAQVGPKAMKAGEKVNMTPDKVAAIAVDAMLHKKTEVITGFINQLGAFLAWLAPKRLSEKVAADLYK